MDQLPDTRGDHYIELMRDSRGLTAEQSEQRERWFSQLDLPDKEEALFELEMLLKAAVCFGNPRNQPGAVRLEDLERRHFHRELIVLQQAFVRIGEICERLASPQANVTRSDIFMVSGPLETVSTPLLEEPFAQVTPDESIQMLHAGFLDLAEVAETLAESERIPYRLFRSVVAMAGREVARNVFFNPLVTLEFCTEYDHLQHMEILHIVYGGGPDGAQRASTLAFLALHRMLRYLDIAERYLDEGTTMLAFLPLSVARSDGVALAGFMRDEARRWLSSGFEREVMTLSAREIMAAADELERDFRLLHELGAMLRAVGDQLHLEVRKTFEYHLRPLYELKTPQDTMITAKAAIADLRGFLMQSVVRVAQVYKPELEGPQIFEDFLDERSQLERLRRDIWIFSQIIRGFLAKAAAAPETVNRWTAQSSYKFVSDFINYFRNLGYHLLRSSRYERFSEFMAQVEGLSATPVHDDDSIEVFVEECVAFREHLKSAFESLSASPLLAGEEFDKHGAAMQLKLYLDKG